MAAKYPAVIQQVRGLGLMIGIELAGKIPAFSRRSEKSPAIQFINHLHEAGLLAIPVWRQDRPGSSGPESAAGRSRRRGAHHRIRCRKIIPMKHLLSMEKLSRADIEHILAASAEMKKERGRREPQPLAGQTWALLFAKSSTRTRVSFEVGIRELGGQAMFLNASEIQLGRGEPIKDTARVLGRMIHGAVIRTYAQKDVEEFAQYAGIPTINALTDEEHPCQIIADIFTWQEKRGPIRGKKVAFFGDGACNVPASWIFAAAETGF